MKGRILVVDDEKNITFVLQAMLEREGYEVLVTNESTQAIEWIEQEEFDVVVTDLFMPKKDGMEVLTAARLHRADLPVIMITAFGTVESAVGALKKGAFDYISKPFDQVDLLKIIDKACKTSRARANEPSENIEEGTVFLGRSEEARKVVELVQKIAQTDIPVLLLGEIGSGKERLARQIHMRSSRAKGPFIRISCSSMMGMELRDELFGKPDKPGRWDLAREGTLYLEEVECLSSDIQSQLVQRLESAEGGRVRLISATDKNPEEEITHQRLRRDFVTRLASFTITVPSLRQRMEDLEQCIAEFLPPLCQKLSKPVQKVEAAALTALRNYSWPGNLRQLQNVLERAILLSDTPEIQLRDLPEELLREGASTKNASSSETGMDFKEIVRRKTQSLEKELIEKALEETQGNVTRAAEKLGLSRKGLQLKMKELDLRRF